MATMRTITADDLAAAGPHAVVIDVRSAEEHATAHIRGSLNIPVEELPHRLKDVPNTRVHVLCGSGKRSSQTAAILTDHGYDAVNVAGGITEWYRNGHPVSYAPPPAADSHARRRHPLASRLRQLLRIRRNS